MCNKQRSNKMALWLPRNSFLMVLLTESRTSSWFLVNMSHNNNHVINVAASQVMDAFT